MYSTVVVMRCFHCDFDIPREGVTIGRRSPEGHEQPHCRTCDRLKRLIKAYEEFLEAINEADMYWWPGPPALPPYLYTHCTHAVVAMSHTLHLRVGAFQGQTCYAVPDASGTWQLNAERLG